MLRLRRMGIDTLSEHVVFIHESAVAEGRLGFQPLDRVRLIDQGGRELTGVLNFCSDTLLARDEIGLSDVAFRDFGLPEGSHVRATHAPAPASVERVRHKLRGGRLARADFDAVLRDVCARRYSKPELSMFVLACALRRLDERELIDFSRAMIEIGERLEFDVAGLQQLLFPTIRSARCGLKQGQLRRSQHQCLQDFRSPLSGSTQRLRN